MDTSTNPSELRPKPIIPNPQLIAVIEKHIMDIQIRIAAHSKAMVRYTFWNKLLEYPKLIMMMLTFPSSGVSVFQDIPVFNYITLGFSSVILILQAIQKKNDYEKIILSHRKESRSYTQILNSIQTRILEIDGSDESLKTLLQDLLNKISVLDQTENIIPDDILEEVKKNLPTITSLDILKQHRIQHEHIPISKSPILHHRLTSLQKREKDDKRDEKKGDERKGDVLSTPIQKIDVRPPPVDTKLLPLTPPHIEDTSSSDPSSDPSTHVASISSHTKDVVGALIQNVDHLLEKEGKKVEILDQCTNVLKEVGIKLPGHVRHASRDLLNVLKGTKDNLEAIHQIGKVGSSGGDEMV